MENGGYGPPDNDDMEDDFDETTFLDDNGRRSRRGNRSRRHRHQGVNERSRRRWEHFKFHNDMFQKKKMMMVQEDKEMNEKENGKSSTEETTTTTSSTTTTPTSSAPTTTTTTTTTEEDVPTCSICLDEYENGDDLTRLPCQHTYHTQCIDAWCSNHVRCPLCNANLDEESSSTLNQNESSGSRRFPRFGRSDSIV